MYDHLLRIPKRTLLLPLAKRMTLSPNTLTGVGLLFGLAAALFCVFGFFRAALVFWVFNRLLDGLDGEVARAQKSQTDLGGYLDILSDLLVYAAIPAGLALYHNNSTVWFATVFMLSSFYLNVGSWMYLSSILEKRGQGAEASGEVTTVAMPKGLIEGGETALFFTFFLLFPEKDGPLFLLFATLTFWTALARVIWARRRL